MSIEFYVFITSLFLVSIGEIYQTFKKVLYHIYKHLEVSQKYSTGPRFFCSLLTVWKCDQTRSIVFDKRLSMFSELSII